MRRMRSCNMKGWCNIASATSSTHHAYFIHTGIVQGVLFRAEKAAGAPDPRFRACAGESVSTSGKARAILHFLRHPVRKPTGEHTHSRRS